MKMTEPNQALQTMTTAVTCRAYPPSSREILVRHV